MHETMTRVPVEGDLYETVIEGVPAMLWLGDPKGKCIFLNRAQREFWGVDDSNMSNFDWSRTVHPDDIEVLAGPYSEAMKGQKRLDVEARYRRADGRWRILRTSAQPRFGAGGRFLGMVGVNVDVTEQREAEEALRRSSEHLRLALDASGGIGTWVWDVPEDRVFADANFASIFDVTAEAAAVGAPVKAFLDGLHDDDRASIAAAIDAVLETGGAFDCEFRVTARPGRWFAALGDCLTDTTGAPTRFPGVVIDITDRREREERLSLLTHELTHRIKNVFAVVSSMTSQAAKQDPDATTTLQALTARFQAMSVAYVLATTGPGEAPEGSLMVLIDRLLAPYGTGRIQVDGPDLRIGPKAASAIALILHEMATNAAKYGALAGDGTVNLAITTDGGKARFSWVETGGPEAAEPQDSGFGSRLIAANLAALDAVQNATWGPEGLHWTMELPLARLAD